MPFPELLEEEDSVFALPETTGLSVVAPFLEEEHNESTEDEKQRSSWSEEDEESSEDESVQPSAPVKKLPTVSSPVKAAPSALKPSAPKKSVVPLTTKKAENKSAAKSSPKTPNPSVAKKVVVTQSKSAKKAARKEKKARQVEDSGGKESLYSRGICNRWRQKGYCKSRACDFSHPPEWSAANRKNETENETKKK